MKSALNDATAQELLSRIERVGDDTKALWGRFTAAKMLTHLVDGLRMAVGELPAKSKRLPIRYFPLKQLILYVFPFPKSAPTAPELLRETPEPVDTAKAELQRLTAKFLAMGRTGNWPEHPAFGKLTTKDWGVLVYKHSDHHLRQFGV